MVSAKVAYNNLVQSIERWYYMHGMYCSSNAYKVISFTCFIITVMSIGILYSPLVFGNAVIEWRSSSKDQAMNSNRSPQWLLSSPPLASVQHFMLQLQHDTPFEAIETMFTIQDRILKTSISTEEGDVFLLDVCFKAPKQDRPVRGFPEDAACLFLTPTYFWGNDKVTFLSDPDITETLLGDSSSPNLRGLMFGTSWTTPPHPITLTLFLNPSLPTNIVTLFRESIINQLSETYTVSILTEQEFKSDYIFMKNAEKKGLFSVEDKRIHLFYSDKISLLQLLPLAMLYVLVFIYIVISVRKITLVKSKVGLACVAVATIVFSFVMSIGFCVFFDLLPTLTGSDIFPYIFTLVGLENVLSITRSVTITAGDQEVHSRVAQGLSTEGTKITKNVCGLALMFFAGICSPVPAAFHEFCVVGLVCVICDFFLQLFFFVPVLSLDIRRLELSDLKSGPYPAPSTPVNGELPDWTDRPRKTKIFRHHATHKILMISVFMYVCYVVYHSLSSSSRESDDKKLSMPGVIAISSTRLVNWVLSLDCLQPRSKGDRSSYEEMFPQAFLASDNTVDMLDVSWRRVARDNWPLLFKQYNIVVTGRYFDVYKPIYVKEKGGISPTNQLSFQSQVRQWLQMPVTLHLISTVIGLLSFLPFAVLLYLSFIGFTKILYPRNKALSVQQQGIITHPILEVPFIMDDHSEDIEHASVNGSKVLTTSFDGLSVLWDVMSSKVLLNITSEIVPWSTAVSDKLILLGHSDGSVNVVNVNTNNVITLHQQTSGVVLLNFINQTSILVCHESGTVLTVMLTPEVLADQQVSNLDSQVSVQAKCKIYPGSLVHYCGVSQRLAVCGGSNIVKVYDAMTLTVRRVVQFPQSVDHLYLVGDLVVASDNFSAIYACNICLPNVFEEYTLHSSKTAKIISTEEMVVSLDDGGSILIWERAGGQTPQQIDVIAEDISFLLSTYLLILTPSSLILWSLPECQTITEIPLDRYTGERTGGKLRMDLGRNCVVVVDGSRVIPVTVVNQDQIAQ